jgi:hypothetical protein
MMMHKHVYAPMFKGVINTDEPEALELVTRQNRVTGTMMDKDQYLRLLRDAWFTHPFLAQDVTRASAAALLRNALSYRLGHPQLVAVEGCEHRVGGKLMSGAQIMESIWKNVVGELTLDYPKPIIEHTSRSTVEEVRAILRYADHNGSVELVTDDYHVPRTERIAREEKLYGQQVAVHSPFFIAHSSHLVSPQQRFAVDICRTSEEVDQAALDAYFQKERKGETRVLGPLHAISRRIERMTFGKVNVETAMAKALRKGYSTAKTAS